MSLWHHHKHGSTCNSKTFRKCTCTSRKEMNSSISPHALKRFIPREQDLHYSDKSCYAVFFGSTRT